MNIVYGCASLTANWIMLEEHNRKALKLRPSSGKFLIELNLSPHSSFGTPHHLGPPHLKLLKLGSLLCQLPCYQRRS